MKKVNIFLMFFSVLFMVSCESNSTQDISVVVANPTYVSNIGPIFNTKCAGCHSSNGQNPALNNYENVKSAYINGKVLCKIEGSCGSIMPPGAKLPQATIDMIKAWAVNGYVNQ
ncbi:cytochrome c [Flavobacterium sp. 123]|jgi:mono/diheme cytochrome c family protein|uniref:c-type cytochrome n=1 Tax=Flavobacterium sp. 123 TaxID=2135627 RepID=UPI000EB5CD4F|nr:cytochrome c [Flavobacterium sp. 123]RKS98335.1 hypothetical protein C8C88_0055 [Flavobacterium sp. 123]